MTMNLDALERAAVAGTMKWRDAHALVSLARQLLRLRAVARDFYNATVANPELRLSASNKKIRDEAIRAGERLRESLEATAPGAAPQSEHAENTPLISANSAEISDRAQIIARAVAAHGRKWPGELTSGVMFYEGERITRTEFLAGVRS